MAALLRRDRRAARRHAVMEEAGVIADYAEALAGKLAFDRRLARRVRQEVEDHLHDAVAADPAGDPAEAERRAIAAFGDPQAIAAQFGAGALVRQARSAGTTIILVLGGVFIAMKARLAWYVLTQWAVSEETRALSDLVGMLDRYAFWLAVALGAAGWAYIVSRGTPARFHAACRTQSRRIFRLCAAATSVLVAAVIADGVLTALRLGDTAVSAAFLIPVLSMAAEIAAAGFLVCRLHGMTRRMASIAALLEI
ncbi:MAG TPA: permease prefix domain 1-containing protein, partial [Stellaceae bacterium]|nr:permease prefix domain 1-containing protein [Stellaceae bacterium]